MWTKQKHTDSYQYTKDSHQAILCADDTAPNAYWCELKNNNSKNKPQIKKFRANSLQYAKLQALLLLEKYVKDEMAQLNKTIFAIVTDREKLND